MPPNLPSLPNLPNQLLDYLPTLYRTDPLVGQFLLAFEKILLGRPDGVPFPNPNAETNPLPERTNQGLEESIAQLHHLFDAETTPPEFLPWLADWVALSLRADLKLEQQRQFIANAISRYQLRGTKANLQSLLQTFTIGVPTIVEFEPPILQIGVNSVIGSREMQLRGGTPHHFRVTIALSREQVDSQGRQLARQRDIAKNIIDLEKPAHTDYSLDIIFPSMQIGVYSTVGVDTLLGFVPQSSG
ncbi:MAG: phage tail protein I [Elainella sp. C42_A2020_010]|nr:phage tail protein I [Elainella sp. C42_A2020_010]